MPFIKDFTKIIILWICIFCIEVAIITVDTVKRLKINWINLCVIKGEMHLLLTIMKNSYLNLAFVFGSVAMDDDMHFKTVKLEGPPIVTK
jgi:hypothetical protein